MELRINIPEEMKDTIEKSKNINWSRIARIAILEKIKQLEFLKHFKSDSELTEEEALNFGREVNKKAAKKYAEI